ncbi:sulfurtransferase TusA family protein [Dethiobacter alkaliphilus]|uniref:sulfurtransferase TusA family protein n=1 Tax=Dethiobacter alkaliphilus TaxID=427926 RepID=UPI0022260D37|nr:sulfurtransferase TusA family protein [Dethiobacter alkaliphilus]MCW3490730.1 sulfurtransferase TusA family protein [Dethiobacter alkaliphilus]
MTANVNLDVRGLSCPEPVIRTKNALGTGHPALPLTVVADSFVAAENIRRLATGMGFSCQTLEQGSEFVITIDKEV